MALQLPSWISRVHAFLYRLLGGKFGMARAAGMDMLLLTTTGRKSGRPRTTPLTYIRDGERFVLAASNGGRNAHAAWFLNIKKNPDVLVQAGKEKFTAAAYVAEGEERERYWDAFKELSGLYKDYEKMASRTIPVVVVKP